MESTDALYQVSLLKSFATVRIEPGLTDAEWAQIESAGDDILAQIAVSSKGGRKPISLLVDLSALEYMGSSMVAMIVRCWKSLNPKRDRFVVIVGNNVVKQVLELSGLSQMWTIVESRDAGLKSLGISPKQAAREAAGKSDPGWATGLSLVALLAAVAGIGLWFAQPEQQQLATGLIYGGAACGVVFGLTIMIGAHSRRKFLGLGVVLLSIGASVFRLIQ